MGYHIGMVIAIAVAISALFSLLQYSRVRAERRLAGRRIGKIRPVKTILAIFIAFAVLVFAGMITVAVLFARNGATAYQFWVAEGVCALFLAVALLGIYCWAADYVAITADGILAQSPFSGVKKVKYEDMAWCTDVSVDPPEFVCYDSDGIKLFGVSRLHVGADRVAGAVISRGVKVLPPTYALRQFEGNPRFILSKKKTSSAVTFGLLLGFAAVTLLLVPLIFPQLKLHTFENYTVSGTVAACTAENGAMSLALEGDENVYRVNNIVYGEIDPDTERSLPAGTDITLTVAYEGEDGALNVSGIYAGGVQYLDPADSERAERDNFNAGRIVCYVFIAVGCVLIAASVPFCIRLVKLKKQLERDIH